MQIDFTQIFKTPAELAEFLMLPQEQQNIELAERAASVKNLVMSCNLSKRKERGQRERISEKAVEAPAAGTD